MQIFTEPEFGWAAIPSETGPSSISSLTSTGAAAPLWLSSADPTSSNPAHTATEFSSLSLKTRLNVLAAQCVLQAAKTTTARAHAERLIAQAEKGEAVGVAYEYREQALAQISEEISTEQPESVSSLIILNEQAAIEGELANQSNLRLTQLTNFEQRLAEEDPVVLAMARVHGIRMDDRDVALSDIEVDLLRTHPAAFVYLKLADVPGLDATRMDVPKLEQEMWAADPLGWAIAHSSQENQARMRIAHDASLPLRFIHAEKTIDEAMARGDLPAAQKARSVAYRSSLPGEEQAQSLTIGAQHFSAEAYRNYLARDNPNHHLKPVAQAADALAAHLTPNDASVLWQLIRDGIDNSQWKPYKGQTGYDALFASLAAIAQTDPSLANPIGEWLTRPNSVAANLFLVHSHQSNQLSGVKLSAERGHVVLWNSVLRFYDPNNPYLVQHCLPRRTDRGIVRELNFVIEQGSQTHQRTTLAPRQHDDFWRTPKAHQIQQLKQTLDTDYAKALFPPNALGQRTLQVSVAEPTRLQNAIGVMLGMAPTTQAAHPQANLFTRTPSPDPSQSWYDGKALSAIRTVSDQLIENARFDAVIDIVWMLNVSPDTGVLTTAAFIPSATKDGRSALIDDRGWWHSIDPDKSQPLERRIQDFLQNNALSHKGRLFVPKNLSSTLTEHTELEEMQAHVLTTGQRIKENVSTVLGPAAMAAGLALMFGVSSVVAAPVTLALTAIVLAGSADMAYTAADDLKTLYDHDALDKEKLRVLSNAFMLAGAASGGAIGWAQRQALQAGNRAASAALLADLGRRHGNLAMAKNWNAIANGHQVRQGLWSSTSAASRGLAIGSGAYLTVEQGDGLIASQGQASEYDWAMFALGLGQMAGNSKEVSSVRDWVESRYKKPLPAEHALSAPQTLELPFEHIDATGRRSDSVFDLYPYGDNEIFDPRSQPPALQGTVNAGSPGAAQLEEATSLPTTVANVFSRSHHEDVDQAPGSRWALPSDESSLPLSFKDEPEAELVKPRSALLHERILQRRAERLRRARALSLLPLAQNGLASVTPLFSGARARFTTLVPQDLPPHRPSSSVDWPLAMAAGAEDWQVFSSSNPFTSGKEISQGPTGGGELRRQMPHADESLHSPARTNASRELSDLFIQHLSQDIVLHSRQEYELPILEVDGQMLQVVSVGILEPKTAGQETYSERRASSYRAPGAHPIQIAWSTEKNVWMIRSFIDADLGIQSHTLKDALNRGTASQFSTKIEELGQVRAAGVWVSKPNAEQLSNTLRDFVHHLQLAIPTKMNPAILAADFVLKALKLKEHPRGYMPLDLNFARQPLRLYVFDAMPSETKPIHEVRLVYPEHSLNARNGSPSLDEGVTSLIVGVQDPYVAGTTAGSDAPHLVWWSAAAHRDVPRKAPLRIANARFKDVNGYKEVIEKNGELVILTDSEPKNVATAIARFRSPITAALESGQLPTGNTSFDYSTQRGEQSLELHRVAYELPRSEPTALEQADLWIQPPSGRIGSFLMGRATHADQPIAYFALFDTPQGPVIVHSVAGREKSRIQPDSLYAQWLEAATAQTPGVALHRERFLKSSYRQAWGWLAPHIAYRQALEGNTKPILAFEEVQTKVKQIDPSASISPSFIERTLLRWFDAPVLGLGAKYAEYEKKRQAISGSGQAIVLKDLRLASAAVVDESNPDHRLLTSGLLPPGDGDFHYSLRRAGQTLELRRIKLDAASASAAQLGNMPSSWVKAPSGKLGSFLLGRLSWADKPSAYFLLFDTPSGPVLLRSMADRKDSPFQPDPLYEAWEQSAMRGLNLKVHDRQFREPAYLQALAFLAGHIAYRKIAEGEVHRLDTLHRILEELNRLEPGAKIKASRVEHLFHDWFEAKTFGLASAYVLNEHFLSLPGEQRLDIPTIYRELRAEGKTMLASLREVMKKIHAADPAAQPSANTVSGLLYHAGVAEAPFLGAHYKLYMQIQKLYPDGEEAFAGFLSEMDGLPIPAILRFVDDFQHRSTKPLNLRYVYDVLLQMGWVKLRYLFGALKLQSESSLDIVGQFKERMQQGNKFVALQAVLESLHALQAQGHHMPSLSIPNVVWLLKGYGISVRLTRLQETYFEWRKQGIDIAQEYDRRLASGEDAAVDPILRAIVEVDPHDTGFPEQSSNAERSEILLRILNADSLDPEQRRMASIWVSKGLDIFSMYRTDLETASQKDADARIVHGIADLIHARLGANALPKGYSSASIAQVVRHLLIQFGRVQASSWDASFDSVAPFVADPVDQYDLALVRTTVERLQTEAPLGEKLNQAVLRVVDGDPASAVRDDLDLSAEQWEAVRQRLIEVQDAQTGQASTLILMDGNIDDYVPVGDERAANLDTLSDMLPGSIQHIRIENIYWGRLLDEMAEPLVHAAQLLPYRGRLTVVVQVKNPDALRQLGAGLKRAGFIHAMITPAGAGRYRVTAERANPN